MSVGNQLNITYPLAIGKSSLLVRYVKEQFNDGYNVTVGVEFLVKQLTLDDGTKVAL